MKILVTGGAGFIGSHIAEVYIQAGFKVVIVDNLSSGRRENIPPQAQFYEADICDKEVLEKIFQKEKPTIVNHHAAQIDVRFSVTNPEEDAQKNIVAGIGLLELSRKYHARKWIYASSGGALYGEIPGKPAKEDFKVKPISPYGASKYCLEKYIELYSRLYSLKYTILRYANVYGPRQISKAEGGVIAIFISALLNRNSITIFGDGHQKRDFVYVEDIAQANLLSLNAADQKIVNIGTAKATSVQALFNILKRELKYEGYPQFASKRPGEILRSVIDNALAQKTLHWKPNTSLVQGLQKTLRWGAKRIGQE